MRKWLGNVSNSLKGRLLLFMVPVSLLVGAGMYAAFFSVVSESIRDLAGRFAEQKVRFYADKATRILVRERDIMQRMAASPVLLAWARNESDARLRKAALALLEQHRMALRDRSYFIVIDSSGH